MGTKAAGADASLANSGDINYVAIVVEISRIHLAVLPGGARCREKVGKIGCIVGRESICYAWRLPTSTSSKDAGRQIGKGISDVLYRFEELT